MDSAVSSFADSRQSQSSSGSILRQQSANKSRIQFSFLSFYSLELKGFLSFQICTDTHEHLLHTLKDPSLFVRRASSFKLSSACLAKASPRLQKRRYLLASKPAFINRILKRDSHCQVTSSVQRGCIASLPNVKSLYHFNTQSDRQSYNKTGSHYHLFLVRPIISGRLSVCCSAVISYEPSKAPHSTL